MSLLLLFVVPLALVARFAIWPPVGSGDSEWMD